MDCCKPQASPAPSRSDKWWPFVQHGLTHFIDDQVEVLVSIRVACWERRRARPRHCSLCLQHGPVGSVVTLGGRALMPPAPARAGGRHDTFTRSSLWAGCAPGTRTGRPGTRPPNFRRTGEFALESCSSVKAPRLGCSVEWRRSGRAGHCCCGLPSHSLHTRSRTHAPHAQATFLFFLGRTPTAEQATYTNTVWQG